MPLLQVDSAVFAALFAEGGAYGSKVVARSIQIPRALMPAQPR
ncbi:MAG TPA: hypothetical protein VFD90_05660 [Gaiellales bacterium]|nr:hypothetical protein [Gaiellales bacterium]